MTVEALIKPICDLLSSKGAITFYSCEGHSSGSQDVRFSAYVAFTAPESLVMSIAGVLAPHLFDYPAYFLFCGHPEKDRVMWSLHCHSHDLPVLEKMLQKI